MLVVAGDDRGGGPRQGRGHQVGGVQADAHQQEEGKQITVFTWGYRLG